MEARRKAGLVDRLPPVRGQYRENADLSKSTWFAVGGPADVLFKPADAEDLANFLKNKPVDISHLVLGVGSNVLVRDGGIDGVVIRLGKGFTEITLDDNHIICGAGALDLNIALYAQKIGLTGLEFLSGIPGTLGGAVKMNAGAYGCEIKDVLVSACAIDNQGNTHTLSLVDLAFTYRHSALPEGWIITSATLKGTPGDKQEIAERIRQIREEREASQPTRARTGGSTFKNPDTNRAWELIDQAGCRGLQVGGAIMSEKHCNFMINTGTASAQDLETLGETVKQKVLQNSGIALEWEIKRIGKK